jgi:alpha-beta hydrolase superfamily lysophospholipase
MIYATVDSYSDWQTLADRAAVDYKAGKEAPIILIGHSLGADAVMEMAAYLGRKGVPVALVVPFDCTKSFAASDNVARVLNLTHGGTQTICEADRVSTARSPMSMSVPIQISTTSISTNHRNCMHAL